MRNALGNPFHANHSFDWDDVPVGGGGYASNVKIAALTGRQMMGTDTHGCYVRDPGDDEWTTVFTTDSMQPEDYEADNNKGGSACIWLAIAPSDNDVMYSALNGYIFRVDKDPAKAFGEAGAITCTRWDLAPKMMNSGGGWSRWWTGHIDVHPTDPDIVLVGTSNEGAYYTLNGGTTVTEVDVPAATGLTEDTPNTYFDPTTGENGHDSLLVAIDQGDPNYCYIMVGGVGLHRSTTGVTGTFSLLAGTPTPGPTSATCLCCDQLGRLWITGDERVGVDNGGLWSLDRGATTYTEHPNPLGGAPNHPWQVAVDPFDEDHVIVTREQPVARSIDRGVTWTGVYVDAMQPGEAPWHVTTSPKLAGGLAFDPTTEDRFLIMEGFGAMETLDARADPIILKSYVAGTEQKIAVTFLSIPGKKSYVTSMDRPSMRIDSLTEYINQPKEGPIGYEAVQQGLKMDYAIDDPDFLVQGISEYLPLQSYSPDAGDTWRHFTGWPTTPNSYGFTGVGPSGSIAVSNKNNIVACPSNNAYASYSLNGGATWSPVLLNGSTDYCTSAAYFIRSRVVIASDKTRPGVFAMVVNVNNPGVSVFTNPLGGLWVTEDGGVNWTHKCGLIVAHPDSTYAAVSATGQDARQYYACQIGYVDGFSGELLYTSHDDFDIDKFWWSQDDGVTWTEPNTLVRNVNKFGFGKPLPGQESERPPVYFFGDYNGVRGSWATFDWFATFVQLSDEYVGGEVWGAGAGASADRNAFGRMFVTIQGKGSKYSIYRDPAQIRVLGTSLNGLVLDSVTAPEDAAATFNIINATEGSTITVESGSLPAGLTLDGTTITGTPTTPGASIFMLRETLVDALNSPRDTTLTITVSEVVAPDTPTLTGSVTPLEDTAELALSTNVTAGTLSFVFLVDGSPEPDAAEIKAGTDGAAGAAFHAQQIPYVGFGNLVFDIPDGFGLDTAYMFRAVITRASDSADTAILSDDFTTLGEVAEVPTLTGSADGAARGAQYTFSTDVNSGTIYAVALPAASSQPTPTQIKAGQDASGSTVAAGYAVSKAATGIAPFTVRTMSATPASYVMYAVQETTEGEFSNVVTDTFTTPLVYLAGAYDGTPTTNLIVGANAIIANDEADSDGGAKAIRVTDSNAGGTGQVFIQTPQINFGAGVMHIHVKVKKLAGSSVDGFQVASANVTTQQVLSFRFSDGVTSASTWTAYSVTDDGGSWWRVKGTMDMTAFADRLGRLTLQMRSNSNLSSTMTIDGTNQVAIHDFFVTDTAEPA